MAKYKIRYSNGILNVFGSFNLDLRGDQRNGFNKSCIITAGESEPILIANFVEVEKNQNGTLDLKNTTWHLKIMDEGGGNVRIIPLNKTPRDQR
mgnify:FL=1